MKRIFILSPANTGGERAALIYNPRAQFDLVRRLRDRGAPLGEVFAFLSGLYFRGKLTYANRFARPPRGIPGVVVITTNRGLLPADAVVTLEEVRAFPAASVDPKDPRYAGPLERDAALLAKVTGRSCEAVFLGSISTKKYVELLIRHFEERLLFPPAFVGRGDMSRGGLLLRCFAENREIEYAPLTGAARRGTRPPSMRAQPRRFGAAGRIVRPALT